MVYLWTQYRTFSGKEPLREVYDGDFIIVDDDDLYDDFKLFNTASMRIEYFFGLFCRSHFLEN